MPLVTVPFVRSPVPSGKARRKEGSTSPTFRQTEGSDKSCPNTTTARRASLKPFTQDFKRDLKNCSSTFRDIAERKLLLNLCPLFCL
ncbi:hypothetical protein Nmel_006316 [Mimus melanotis]